MQPEPGETPDDSLARVSELLAEVLAAPLAEQTDVLARLCAEHHDCAPALRQGYGSLQQFDLVRVGEAEARTAPATTSDTTLPRTFGTFRLLEFLGAGGMGSVYRAEDLELKRTVALKLIRSEMLASERTRNRFQREAAALARLDHAGLCTVFRAGTTDGQPWIAMRFVRGTTLAQQLQAASAAAPSGGTASTARRGGSSHTREQLQRTLLLFEKIARALHTAHQAGVVHRDIKPANLVLTGDDEPIVIDFGLVHLDDSESQLTMSGDHIGTPAYMAPEQVAATGRSVTAATDIYALAVTLFEALTGTSPYTAHTREELFVHIVRGERRRLRQGNRSLPADLEVVVEKALDVDPARRYPDMLAFADDLRRVRQHEPPAARRLGFALRGRRWCQRNPVAATVLGLLTAGLAIVLALDASRQAALQRSLAMAYGNLAGQVLEKNPEHALELALRGVERAPQDPESLGMLLGALQEVHERQTWELPWPKYPPVHVQRVVPSPRGDVALVLGSYTANTWPPAALWNGTSCRPLPVEEGTLDVRWSTDGGRFLTTMPRRPPQLWTAAGEPLPLAWPPPSAPPTVQCARAHFLANDQAIVFACGDGTARILRLDTGAWLDLSPPLCLKTRGMPGLAVSLDGKRLALGDYNGLVVVHEVEAALAGQEGHELPSATLPATELDLGATGTLLLVRAMNPDRCEAWTWQGERLRSWGRIGAPADPAPLDPAANRFVEAAKGHMPRLWELVDGKLEFRHELCEHDGQINGFAYSRDGRILSVGIDDTARIVRLEGGATEVRLRGFQHELQAGAFLADGSHLLLATTSHLHRIALSPVAGTHLPVDVFADKWAQFGGADWNGAILTADITRTISLHDPSNRTVRRIQEDGFLRRSALLLSADGHWLASANNKIDGQSILNVYGPGLVRTHTIARLGMERPAVAFGPADQLLLVDTNTPEKGTCALHLPTTPGTWQPAPTEVQETFASLCAGAIAIAYHAGSSTLAVAREAGGVALLRWQESPPALLPGPTLLPGRSARIVAFAPDGEQLLCACRDRVVRMVDRAGNPPLELTGHLGTVVSLEFSPRGDRLLVAATDSGLTVHDLQGNRLLAIQPEGSMAFARFLPAGDRILYGDTNRTTRIVPFERDEILRIARGVSTPAMSEAHDNHYRARAGDEPRR